MNPKLRELEDLIDGEFANPEVERAAKLLIKELSEQRREIRLGDLLVSYRVYP